MAADTKWTEWKGLPGHAQLHTWMREKADWKTTPVVEGREEHGRRRRRRSRRPPKTLTASYELPFMKHAPIGPTIAVGDVQADGTVFVHTHNQNPQALRGQIAMMLGTPVDNVVVRIYAGPGHYGRSNGGNAGAEDEAVHPVEGGGQARARAVDARRRSAVVHAVAGRVSRTSASARTRSGKITAYQADHYMPAMQDDRLVGAVIAGLPTPPRARRQAPSGSIGSTVNAIQDPWVYEQRAERRRVGARHVPGRAEGVAARRSACATTACGRRGSSSRTSRASWRSARRRRWPASTPSSSA